MCTPILRLRLQGKRDLVLARQYARQIAGLLGFGPHEQMEIAAIVFEIAQAARAGQVFNRSPSAHSLPQRSRSSSIQFQVAGDSLEVFPVDADCTSRRMVIPPAVRRNGLRLVVPLPEGTDGLARDDVRWMMQQLTQLTPVNLFEELQRQNQEFLQTLQQLQACQAELEQIHGTLNKSAAA